VTRKDPDSTPLERRKGTRAKRGGWGERQSRKLSFVFFFDLSNNEATPPLSRNAQKHNKQRVAAEAVLKAVQSHPDAWSRVDAVLEHSTNAQSKFFALQILEDVIKRRWGALPDEQRAGVRNFVSNMIISVASSSEASKGSSRKDERTFLHKLDVALVQILKQDWPHAWPQFVPDLCAASRASAALCENSMTILKLLSEEVFDFSRGELTQAKTRELKASLNTQFGAIHELCMFALAAGAGPLVAGDGSGGAGAAPVSASLVRATLDTLHAYLSWVSTGCPSSSSPFFTSFGGGGEDDDEGRRRRGKFTFRAKTRSLSLSLRGKKKKNSINPPLPPSRQVPLGYVFESDVVAALLRLFPVPAFRNASLKCLTEVAALSVGPERDAAFVSLATVFVAELAPMLPADCMSPQSDAEGGLAPSSLVADPAARTAVDHSRGLSAAYAAGSDEDQDFVQNLSLFLTTFLRAHLRALEADPAARQPGGGALLRALDLLASVSFVPDEEVFKICLDYWHHFVPGVYAGATAAAAMASAAAAGGATGFGAPPGGGFGFGSSPASLGGGGTPSAAAGDVDARRLYARVLSRLRSLMIARMAKPEEVIVVEDPESGTVVREAMKVRGKRWAGGERSKKEERKGKTHFFFFTGAEPRKLWGEKPNKKNRTPTRWPATKPCTRPSSTSPTSTTRTPSARCTTRSARSSRPRPTGRGAGSTRSAGPSARSLGRWPRTRRTGSSSP